MSAFCFRERIFLYIFYEYSKHSNQLSVDNAD